MALGTISLPQRPVESAAKVPAITNWTPVLPQTAKQTSITDLFYFKFILEIRIDDGSGELLAKIKQRPNGYTTGTTNVYTVFNIRDIINTQLENTYADQNDTTKSIHTLGANVAGDPFSKNSNQLKKIYVKAYQEYSAAADISPTENNTENAENTKYYIAASLPLETARTAGTYFQGTAFQGFRLNGIAARFLSDVQKSTGDVVSTSVYRNYVQWNDDTDTGDYHTIGFLNGETDFDSKGRYFVIKYYEADGTQLNAGTEKQLSNKNDAGGAQPLTSGTEVDNDTERLIYLGCGPGNLEAQSYDTDARPSNNKGWAYYTVKASSDGGTGGNSMSALYYFIKQDRSCKGYKVRRLGWRNSLGCWDYFNFKMKSEQSVDVTRNTYGKMLGEFNSTEYSYNNFDATRKVRSTKAMLKEKLNTDWITEEDAELLEKCVMSTDVFIIENEDTDYTVPVMITDKSIVRKTSANNRLKIQYSINIEYANPLNTNS